MLRCQSGDLSGKHTPFKVGGGRQFYNDVNLPLFGRNSGNDHTLLQLIVLVLSLSVSFINDVMLVSDQINAAFGRDVSR